MAQTDSVSEQKNLDEIRKQIKNLQDQERAILNDRDNLYFEKKKAEFDLVKGKMFWSQSNGFGSLNYLNLIKVIDCKEFSSYGSCTVLRIELTYKGDKLTSIQTKEDTQRVDSLNVAYKEVDEKRFNDIKQIAFNETEKIFQTLFKL